MNHSILMLVKSHIAPPEDQREDVTSKLVRHFKQLIRDGVLTPGCRLPSERDLSLNLGVNRGSLRQALKVLQSIGVIHQRVGDGTYLASDARTILREPLDFLLLLSGISNEDLFRFRLLLEPELVAIAARKATDGDRAAMLTANAALRASQTTEERIEADLAFHEAIVRASGDRVAMLVLAVIQRAMLKSMEDSVPQLALEKVVRYHIAIYEAVEKRDPEAARRAMIRHLRGSLASVISLGIENTETA